MVDDKIKLVRRSYCKKCGSFVTSQAIYLFSNHDILNHENEFKKEVEENDLGSEIITLNRFKCTRNDICRCE